METLKLNVFNFLNKSKKTTVPLSPTVPHLPRAAHWADHQWKAEWLHNLTRHRTFISDTGIHPTGMTLPRTAWVRHKPSEPVWDVSDPACTNGYGLLCCLWVWRRSTNRRPCCPPMSNLTTFSWSARPDGSGPLDNRMAAQHLPRYLVRPSSGQQQLAHTTKKTKDFSHSMRGNDCHNDQLPRTGHQFSCGSAKQARFCNSCRDTGKFLCGVERIQ